MKIYTVRHGDTIHSLARRWGVRSEDIIIANHLETPSALVIGQSLLLPTASVPARSIIVNGYISRCSSETVEKTLPYLSLLSPFAYRTDLSGNLHMHYSGSAPTKFCPVPELLTITNQTADGIFSPRIAHAVCCDKKVQCRFFQSVAELLKQSPYYGVNLNFTYLHGFDRDAYTRFFRSFANYLHALGVIVITALPPQTENFLNDPLSGAFDYRAIGEAADYVILLSYDWGNRSSPPAAIAPIGKIRSLLNYAVTQIPAEKLLLSIANYALDWTLPFRYDQNTRILSGVQALELAAAIGAEIRFSESAHAPTFDFYDSTGKYHRVWFEDVRSLNEKYSLVSEYGLAGLSFWNLDHLFTPIFLTLQQRFSVEKLL